MPGKLCLLALIALLLPWVGACSHSPQTAKEKAEADAMSSSVDAVTRLPRPRKASGATLRNWLAAKENKFTLQRINDCQAQVLTVGEAGKDRIELRKLSKQMSVDVAVDTELHHWCYYHLLMRLEQQLEQDQLGQGEKGRLDSFLKEFRGLWILAIALDRHTEQNYYRSVARRRYIDLSQIYFGRKLEAAPGTPEPDDEIEDKTDQSEEDVIIPGDEPEDDEATEVGK